MSDTMSSFGEMPPGAKVVLAREAKNSATALNCFSKLDTTYECSSSPVGKIIFVDREGRLSTAGLPNPVNAIRLSDNMLAFIYSKTEVNRIGC
jgi:hypothetical protein